MDATRAGRGARWRRLGGTGLSLLLGTLSLGADCFPEGGSDAGGYVGLGAPSLEVTVDGRHVGPAPAAAGAYADLTTLRNEFGQLSSTELVIHAQGGIASCDMHLSRFGPGVPPFRAGSYSIRTPVGDTTAEGTASLVGLISVTAGNLSLSCGSADCGGLVLTVLDATHLEGYLSGVLTDPSDGQASTVVCSFYLPWRRYSP